MDPGRYAEVKRVFREAIRWAPEDRAEVVGALAEGNAAVRDEVLSLLAHHRDVAAPGEGGGEAGGGGEALVERRRAEGGAGATLAERLRSERAGGASAGWPLERVVRVLDPVARRLAELADRGGAHGAVRADRVVLVAGDGAEAAGLVGESVRSTDGADGADSAGSAGGADGADAESMIDREAAASAAPEQLLLSLGPIGPWTDVYGLALLCVELMLGRPPAEATVVAALTRARDEAARPSPRTLGLDVPDAVEAVLARALAVRPMERYQDARRFWAALRASLGASAASHAPSPSVPLAKTPIPSSSTAPSPSSPSLSTAPSPSSSSPAAPSSLTTRRAALPPRAAAIAAAALVLLAAVAAAIVRCA